MKIDRQTRALLSLFSYRKKRTNITTDDLIEFTTQIHALLHSGIVIHSALDFVRSEIGCKPLEDALFGVVLTIERGSTFARGLEQYSDIFPEYYVKSVQAAETGGTLTDTLQQLIKYLKAKKQLEYRIRKTFRYPIFVLKTIIAGSIILAFRQGLLPFNLQNVLIIIFLGMLYYNLMYLLKRYFREGSGKPLWDRLRLETRFIRTFYRRALDRQFAEHFSSIYKTGIPIPEVFRLIGDAIDNRLYSAAVAAIGAELERGSSIPDAAGTCPYFSFRLIEHFHTAARTGEYDANLDHFIQQEELFEKEITDRAMLYVYLTYLFLAALLVLFMRGSFNQFTLF